MRTIRRWWERARRARQVRRLRRLEQRGLYVMATAVAGKICKVQIGAVTIAEMGEWSYNPTADLIEKTPFLANSKTHGVGLMDGSGSFAGRLDMTDTLGQVALRNAMLAGTQVTPKLFTDATHFFSGPALIKGMPMKANVAGLVEGQFDFQGDGDWTYT